VGPRGHREDSGATTYVSDGIHRASTDLKPGTSAVWGPQMGPQAAEMAGGCWFSNRSPRLP